jgi:hypothetical protein
MTITLTREEAQQVHDALLNFEGDISDAMFAALTTLRARLAEPEPEAVAWLVTEDGKPIFLKIDKTPAAHVAKRKPNRKLIPLYAGAA